MNTIIFVMMAYTHANNFVPSLIFTSRDKCEAAAQIVYEQSKQRLMWGQGTSRPWCVELPRDGVVLPK